MMDLIDCNPSLGPTSLIKISVDSEFIKFYPMEYSSII
jgi:hypothetical protein